MKPVGVTEDTGRDIILEGGCIGIRDVIDHDAADSLEADKGVDVSADLANHDTFWLRPLVIAAAVKRIVPVVGVEVFRQSSGRDLLKVVTTVKDSFSVGVPNGERARSIGEKLMEHFFSSIDGFPLRWRGAEVPR